MNQTLQAAPKPTECRIAEALGWQCWNWEDSTDTDLLIVPEDRTPNEFCDSGTPWRVVPYDPARGISEWPKHQVPRVTRNEPAAIQLWMNHLRGWAFQRSVEEDLFVGISPAGEKTAGHHELAAAISAAFLTAHAEGNAVR